MILDYNDLFFNYYESGRNFAIAPLCSGILFDHLTNQRTDRKPGNISDAFWERVKNLCIANLISDGGHVLDKASLENILNFRINNSDFFNLRDFVLFNINHFQRRPGYDQAGGQVQNFQERFWPNNVKKRRSRFYRQVFDRGKLPSSVKNRQYMNQLANKLEIIPSDNFNIFVLWSNNALSPKFSNFCYKFCFGRPILNNQVYHFKDVSNRCSFCIFNYSVCRDQSLGQVGLDTVAGPTDLPVEDASHFFWDCSFMQSLLTNFFVPLNMVMDKHGFFLDASKIDVLIIKFLFLYACYKAKIAGFYPSISFLRRDVRKSFEFCTILSKKLLTSQLYAKMINIDGDG